MIKDQGMVPSRGTIGFWLLLVNAIILKSGFTMDGKWYWFLAITIPLQLIALTVFRKKVVKRGEKDKTATVVHYRGELAERQLSMYKP